MSSAYDWSQFTKRITVKASIEQLYTAWSTRSGIESWFLRSSEFIDQDGMQLPANTLVTKGIKYKWRWHGYADGLTEAGEILYTNGKDIVEFSFCGMKVRIEMKTEEGENIVELKQYEIPTDENGKINFHIGCGDGWILYLANLKSVLEGGIDLRNKNEKIKKVINS
jgi:uncharacterized protein YndB with AHSA1/START domain